MEFLRRHIEKLVLGLTLIGLLVSILLLLHAISKTRTTSADMVDQARAAANGGLDMTLIPEEKFMEVYKVMSDPAVRLDILPNEQTEKKDPLRGSLLSPPTYIVCYNEACGRLIPISADVCPFCGTEQPPRRDKEEPLKNDRDRDGIPNFIERKFDFLNPDNPSDARLDQDGDGFLNVEEYAGKTAMDDPQSFPPLGERLRFNKTLRKPLPIKLKRISLNNSEDPEKWTITVEYFDPAKKRWRSKLTGLGKEVRGYKILKAKVVDNPQKKGKKLGIIQVQPPGKDNPKPYVLRQGQTAFEREKYARLYFLRSRYYRYAKRGGVRVLVVKEGDEFPLQIGKAPKVVKERYRLENVSDKGATVVRVDPAPAAGEAAVKIELHTLNPRQDFIPRNTRTANMGGAGMMRGGAMGPGAMMGGGGGSRMPGGTSRRRPPRGGR